MPNIVKNLAFLSCFGENECYKTYFNNSNSSVENANGNKFLTTLLLVKGITLLKIKIFNFLSCIVKIFSLSFVHIIINRTKNYVPFKTSY